MSWMNEIKKSRQDDMRRDGKVTTAENKVGRAKFFFNKERLEKGMKEDLARLGKEIDSMFKSLDKYGGMDIASEEAEEKIPISALEDINRIYGVGVSLQQLNKKMESRQEIKGIVK